MHPLSPLTPPTPVFPSKHQISPAFLHFPPSHLPIVKDPSTPSAAWLRAKHLCGSGWPTLPGSQVALAPPPRSALSVSQSCRSAIQPATAQTDWGGPVRDWGRAASQPEQIRYSNATRQVRKSDFVFFAPRLSIQHFFIVGLYQINPKCCCFFSFEIFTDLIFLQSIAILAAVSIFIM